MKSLQRNFRARSAPAKHYCTANRIEKETSALLFVPSSFETTQSQDIDWFQPFTRRSYVSVRSFIKFCYLPREECFKRENVILEGVIHNMKTMPKSLNPGRHPFN
ncbi:uncharacterized protein LOC141886026 [Acropora palmata]|uniref:uncharacterized protein LOC141886026 n=1 Tax=Acropora palmata TaxID=6131 RepID=UPI003DA08B92